jgi:hypothetical protein
MWIGMAGAVAILGLVLTLTSFRRIDDFPTRALIVALWFRYAFQAFPDISVRLEVAGFTPIALSSLLTIFFLGLLVDKSLLRLRALSLLYLLILVEILSGLRSSLIINLINDLIKWMYFLVVFLLTYRGLTLYGANIMLRAVLLTFTTPLLLQLTSIVTGNVKATEADGSASYIGGYYHEAMFSMIVFSFVVVASLVPWRRRSVGLLLIAVGIVGLLLANYRTTMIGVVPVFAFLALSEISRMAAPKVRSLVALLSTIALVVTATVAWNALPDRFADMKEIAVDREVLMKEPNELTYMERRMFSGRIHLWSEYTHAYFNGSLVERLIGFGPSAYRGNFRAYPHNTFISYLYEFGIIGVSLLVLWLLKNLYSALLFGRDFAWRVFAAQLGFLLIGMATMPLWMIEGMILYAILLAVTWAAAHAPTEDGVLQAATDAFSEDCMRDASPELETRNNRLI